MLLKLRSVAHVDTGYMRSVLTATAILGENSGIEKSCVSTKAWGVPSLTNSHLRSHLVTSRSFILNYLILPDFISFYFSTFSGTHVRMCVQAATPLTTCLYIRANYILHVHLHLHLILMKSVKILIRHRTSY